MNKIYNSSLIGAGLFIWTLIIKAKHAQYDLNFGHAIHAFLLSLGAGIIILFLWIKIRQLIKDNLLITLIFLLTSSPVSLFLFIEMYGRFIGQYFKL